MKGMARIVFYVFMAAVFGLGAGCAWVDEGSDGDGGDVVCCPEPEPVEVVEVVEVWEVCGPEWNTLYVGEECSECTPCQSPACQDPCDPCDCCAWTDQDYSLDTLEFSSWDENLVDLQFNFTLTNWGDKTTYAWVMLCDGLGCEDLVEVELFPGDVYWDRLPNPVLDTALADLYDCLDLWGELCWMEYDVDVYLGEECACSEVTLDYYYEGLYLY